MKFRDAINVGIKTLKALKQVDSRNCNATVEIDIDYVSYALKALCPVTTEALVDELRTRGYKVTLSDPVSRVASERFGERSDGSFAGDGDYGD